jgi:imidazolonepropionase-like amidohydrolase
MVPFAEQVGMKNGLGLLLLSLLLWLLHAQRAAATSAADLVLTHVTVIDATGAPAKPDVTVVITGDRIRIVGRSTEIQAPKNAQVVDARGKFLIPGLWDMHIHWYEKDYLPLFIANGVLGVRIMSGSPIHHEWRKQIEAGTLLGPRMVIASEIVDGPKPLWPGSISVANETQARQAVDRIKQDGAGDFVKVYTFLPREAYFAIAEESKRQGISFEGHVPLSVTTEEASRAGQKSFEHLTGIVSACSTRSEELYQAARADLAEEMVSSKPTFWGPHAQQLRQAMLDTYSPQKATALSALLKSNGTWQCPTLTLLRALGYGNDPAFADDPRLKYMPRQVRAIWDPAHLYGETPQEFALARKEFQRDLEVVGLMQRSGVGILAGTDTLNPFCFPGFSLHDELGLMVKAGLSPMEALQAATLNPARFLDRERELGTVESGKIADLVLLDANPLDDIANTKKIEAVIYRGQYLPRASLDQMLSQAEALAARKSVAEAMMKTIQEKDLAAAVKQYRDLKATQPASYDFSENELNGLGYQLIAMKRFQDAIEILKLNVEVYPESYNTYDSLAEAYMDNGDKDLAVKNYQKSLQLNPQNGNAVEKLKKLNAE